MVDFVGGKSADGDAAHEAAGFFDEDFFIKLKAVICHIYHKVKAGNFFSVNACGDGLTGNELHSAAGKGAFKIGFGKLKIALLAQNCSVDKTEVFKIYVYGSAGGSVLAIHIVNHIGVFENLGGLLGKKLFGSEVIKSGNLVVVKKYPALGSGKGDFCGGVGVGEPVDGAPYVVELFFIGFAFALAFGGAFLALAAFVSGIVGSWLAFGAGRPCSCPAP